MSSENKLLKPTLSTIKEKKNSGLKVLDEDAYIANIEKIIVRDFFPDLPKLSAQLGISDGTSRRETPSVCGTPSMFGTPDTSIGGTPSSKGQPSKNQSVEGTNISEVEEATDVDIEKMDLNAYMQKYTSEDNKSFSEIMTEAQKKHEAKHAWLYKTELLQIEDDPDNKKPQMWKYVAKNAVMYVPEGLELSLSEKLEKSKERKQEICYANTRFIEQPYPQPIGVDAAARSGYNKMEGKIGLDGKEILPSRTPTMGGYRFMGTPSPAPGVDASPLMTWGEIEGTPFKLDGSDTPRLNTPGPVFKIPDVPKRDKLLHQLTEKASRSNRAKKEEALRQAAATFANSPRSFMSKTERLQSLSPAAQRLMANKLRLHSDSPLKASYTPTRQGKSNGNDISTPKSSPRMINTKRSNERTSLLTDNLLNLPTKRSKASDFF